MPIRIHLDTLMARKRITAVELAERIGTTNVNLSRIKNGHIRGIRFSTLEALCDALDCTVGELIEFVPGTQNESDDD